MITIKRTLSTIVITLLFVFESSSAIKDSLFATVGQKAITQSDIVNEIKLILILNGQEFSSEQRDKLQSAAVKSTIKRNVKASSFRPTADESQAIDKITPPIPSASSWG